MISPFSKRIMPFYKFNHGLLVKVHWTYFSMSSATLYPFVSNRNIMEFWTLVGCKNIAGNESHAELCLLWQLIMLRFCDSSPPSLYFILVLSQSQPQTELYTIQIQYRIRLLYYYCVIHTLFHLLSVFSLRWPWLFAAGFVTSCVCLAYYSIIWVGTCRGEASFIDGRHTQGQYILWANQYAARLIVRHCNVLLMLTANHDHDTRSTVPLSHNCKSDMFLPLWWGFNIKVYLAQVETLWTMKDT